MKLLRGTDLEVSELGFGCARLGGVFYKASKSETVALLHSAFDAGITFYDTADIYGRGESEEILGAAFRSMRDRVVITSKVGYTQAVQGRLVDRLKPLVAPVVRRLGLHRNTTKQMRLNQDFSSERILSGIEASLTRLRTDYLDLYMLHGIPDDWDAALDSMERLKQRGLIRHYGVSCPAVQDVAKCLAMPGVSVLQVNVSLLHPEAIALFPEAQQRSIGIVARQCYASGLLSRPSAETNFRDQPPDRRSDVESLEAIAAANGRRLPEVALRFVDSLPEVDVTLVGIRTQGHLQDALDFLKTPALTTAERAALLRISTQAEPARN